MVQLLKQGRNASKGDSSRPVAKTLDALLLPIAIRLKVETRFSNIWPELRGRKKFRRARTKPARTSTGYKEEEDLNAATA